MAGKVLCIELTTYFIRAVEMDYLSKKPKIYKSFVIPTPVGAYSDGTVLINDELINNVRIAIDKKKITTKKVIFNSLSSRIATREVFIPPIKDKRISEFVEANASDYFPVDTTDYEISYVKLGLADEEGNSQLKLQVYAVPNDIIEAYREFANKLNLKFTAFDYTGNSLYQIARSYYNKGTQVFVKIENVSTQVLIMKEGCLELQRTVPYGAKDLFSILIESPNLPTVSSPATAKRFFTEYDIVYDENHEIDITIAERDKIDDNIKSLTGSISRVVDYYTNNNKSVELDSVNIVGVGAYIKGMEKMLAYELNRPVESVNNVKGIALQNIAQYFSCVGSSIQPIILAEKIKDSEEAAADQMRTTYFVFKFLVIIAVALGLVAAGLNAYTLVMKSSLKSEMESLNEAQEVYNNYLDLNQKHAEIVIVEDSMYNMNKQLVAVFEEMEKVLPSSTRISSLSTEDNQLTMTLTVSGKNSAAKTLVELRKMNSLTVVETPGVSQVDESGDVEMTVTAVLTAGATE